MTSPNPQQEAAPLKVQQRDLPSVNQPVPLDGLEFLPHELAVWARVVAGKAGVRPIDVVIECVRDGRAWHRLSRETSRRVA